MSTYVPLRVRIKHQLSRFLPVSMFALVSALWVGLFARFFKVEDILQRYTDQFLKTHPRVVQGGPFEGMRYVERAVGSNYLHKLVGSYESILHPYIAKLDEKQFTTVVDIGCAEGYYLIGLGRKLPGVRLVGFETEASGRELVREMYIMNELKNELVLEGEATAENVTPYLTEGTLLICDCEGAELDILDPVRFPEYATVAMAIIELHDFIRPGIKAELTKRFLPTHTVTVVPYKMADVEQFPFLKAIESESDRYELRRERGWQEQEWLILERK